MKTFSEFDKSIDNNVDFLVPFTKILVDLLSKVDIQKCADELKWDISQYEIIHEPIENNTAEIAAKLAVEFW